MDKFLDWAVALIPTIAGLAWPSIERRVHAMAILKQRIYLGVAGVLFSLLIFYQQHRTRSAHEKEITRITSAIQATHADVKGIKKDSERPISVGPVNVQIPKPDDPPAATPFRYLPLELAFTPNEGPYYESKFEYGNDPPTPDNFKIEYVYRVRVLNPNPRSVNEVRVLVSRTDPSYPNLIDTPLHICQDYSAQPLGFQRPLNLGPEDYRFVEVAFSTITLPSRGRSWNPRIFHAFKDKSPPFPSGPLDLVIRATCLETRSGAELRLRMWQDFDASMKPGKFRAVLMK